MQKVFKLWVLCSIFCLSISDKHVYSQGCCSGGVPISSNLGLGAGEIGTLQFQFTYDQNTLRDLLFEDQRLDDNRRKRNTRSLILETSYDINKAFSLSGLFAFVRQERIIQTQSASEDITVNNGVGDGIILLRYNFLYGTKHPDADFMLGAGPKFPFGKADFTDNRGITLPADLQPGTGAWDAMFWTNFTRRAFIRESLSLNMTATYRATGINPDFNGSQEYEFGNEFQVQVGIQDQWLLGSLLLDPMLGIQYRTVSEDKINGNVFENTGGHWVNLRPGLNVNLTQYSSLRITSSLPIYRYLEGTQLSTSYRFAITYYQSISLSSPSKNYLK